MTVRASRDHGSARVIAGAAGDRPPWRPHRLFVRDGQGTSDDESSGGWGEVIAVVPLDPQVQEDTVVRFNLPLEDIQQEGVSEFNYHLEAYEFGGRTSVHTGTATAIPLPAALPAGLLVLGGVALTRKRNAKQFQ